MRQEIVYLIYEPVFYGVFATTISEYANHNDSYFEEDFIYEL